MTHNLHEFATPFTLYLNDENAQNPTQKHFEKTNNKKNLQYTNLIKGWRSSFEVKLFIIHPYLPNQSSLY